jgi:hypothetical protein
VKHSWASLAGLWSASIILATIVASGVPALAELKQLDLIASSQGTVLKFHSDQALPVTVRQAHYNRLVVRVDEAGSRGTILTNFAQAPNVDHVIVKRLPRHRVDITVLGHRLSEPRILFSLSAPPPSTSSVAATAATSPSTPSPSVIARPSAETVVNAIASPPALAAGAGPTVTALPVGGGGHSPSITTNEPATATLLPSSPLPSPLASVLALIPTVNTEAVMATATAKWIQLQPNLIPLLPYGVTGLLLAGLGVFLWKKARQLVTSQAAMAHAVDAPVLPTLRSGTGSTISAAKLSQAKAQKVKATAKKSGNVTLPPAPVLAYDAAGSVGPMASMARQAMASYQQDADTAKKAVKPKAKPAASAQDSLGVTRPTVPTSASLGGGPRSALSAVAQGATNPDIQAFLEAVASQMTQDDRPSAGKTHTNARFVADH